MQTNLKLKSLITLGAVIVGTGALLSITVASQDHILIETTNNVANSWPTNELEIFGHPSVPISVSSIASTNSEFLTVNCPLWNEGKWIQPTNAADVVIKLTTADGKKWKCKWEEIK